MIKFLFSYISIVFFLAKTGNHCRSQNAEFTGNLSKEKVVDRETLWISNSLEVQSLLKCIEDR